jgi:predicted O-methyltransferase YrrM
VRVASLKQAGSRAVGALLTAAVKATPRPKVGSMTTIPPLALAAIDADSAHIGFPMASDDETGSLLRTLAAGKPGGRLLELGTGTGRGTAWLLDGMDAAARLTTVDREARHSQVARRHLGGDPRLTFHHGDGVAFMRAALADGARFDLIFADSRPGKFEGLDLALDLLAPGGLYFVDDLLPQPNWQAGHAALVEQLLQALDRRGDLHIARLNWSTGLLLAARRGPTT